MKKNTYDVQAYQFRIFTSNKEYKSCGDNEWQDFLLSITRDPSFLSIPWENVDGLTIKEVLECLNRDYIFLTGGVALVNEDWDSLYRTIYTFSLEPSFLSQNKEKRIDEIIEEIMEKQYKNANVEAQRLFKCFFQRYQDNSYEETVERVKKLEM